VELIDRHRLRLTQISTKVGYSKARLSELHLTARAFPTDQRSEGSFYDALMARSIYKRLPRLDMPLEMVKQEITKMVGKRPSQIKAHFINLLIEKDRQDTLDKAEQFPSRNNLINSTHHADWRSIVPLLPDDSVKFFLCDPPFGGYGWHPSGGYISSRADTSGMRCESDNNTDQDALDATLALFKLCLPKMTTGGCLLLFQPGGKPDRPEILLEAQQQGWSCQYGLVWNKMQSLPSDCSYPYAPSSERILIFTKADEQIEWHQNHLSRMDVLDFKSITLQATHKMERGELPFKSIHMFQKPNELCEFLIRKHTHPGDLVVEPFGCSGTGCIAAAGLNRNWLYIESNESNYRWGRSRIEESLALQGISGS
jgi:site-specific DNA-methyltransferase (adenine-specific)